MARRPRESKSVHEEDRLTPAEEAALMQRVHEDAAGAFDELYDRYGSLVFRMAFQAFPTRAEAEDAVQEVFLRLWKTANRYDSEKSALVTWVMLITRRHIIDRLRRARVRVKPSTLGEGWTGEDTPEPQGGSMETQERVANLLERLETLPELQRIVVQRAYLGGKTLRQIAEELDVPLGTVKSALSRALARLRERSASEEAA